MTWKSTRYVHLPQKNSGGKCFKNNISYWKDAVTMLWKDMNIKERKLRSYTPNANNTFWKFSWIQAMTWKSTRYVHLPQKNSGGKCFKNNISYWKDAVTMLWKDMNIKERKLRSYTPNANNTFWKFSWISKKKKKKEYLINDSGNASEGIKEKQ